VGGAGYYVERPTRVEYDGVTQGHAVDADGKPLAELASAEGDPSGYTERLRQFVTERGVQLEYSDSIYPAQGQCTAKKITLLPGQSAAEEFNSLAHEVAHSLLHFRERRGETTKRVRETEAEAAAFVICEAIGLKAQNSASSARAPKFSRQSRRANRQTNRRATIAGLSC